MVKLGGNYKYKETTGTVSSLKKYRVSGGLDG